MTTIKELTISEAIDYLGTCTLEGTFKHFTKIPEHVQDMYTEQYTYIFANHYITKEVKKKLPSQSPLFEKLNYMDFSERCSEFRKYLSSDIANMDKYTASLKRLITLLDNAKAMRGTNRKYFNDLSNNYSNLRKRFWNSFVCNVKLPFAETLDEASAEHGYIYQAEAPFYCILFFIYYLGAFYTDDEIASFFTFKQSLNAYKIHNNINDVLNWCAICYQEWCDTFGMNYEIGNTTLSQYAWGIPLIFERFNYHKHNGKQLLLNFLLDMFKSYNNGSATIKLPQLQIFLEIEIPFLKSIYKKVPMFKQQRKNEIQLKYNDDTRYLKTSLAEYFHTSPQEFDLYVGDTRAEREDNEVQKQIRLDCCKYWANLFLLFTNKCDDNDPLPYVNVIFILSYYSWIYETWLTQKDGSQEYLSNFSDKNTDIFIVEAHNKMYDMICLNPTSRYKEIYSKLMMPYFNEISKETSYSRKEWDENIFRIYAEYISSNQKRMSNFVVKTVE